MYIYSIHDNKATLISQVADSDQLITLETYPARIDHPNTHAVLSYSEVEGIHWEYIPLTPRELREKAYETRKVISFEDELMTIDEANKRWQEYQAESNSKASELTNLIASAKEAIRAEFPDN